MAGSTLAWPDRRCWKAFVGYGALLTLLWIGIYGGACLITSWHSYRVRLHFEFELATPFVPAAAVVYLSLFPMLWTAPFVLQSADRLRRFAKTLACLFVLSGIGFLLVPGDQAYPPQDPVGIFACVFDFADRINLSHNYLPSLHVGMAVVCAIVYGKHVSKGLSMIYLCWALAISVSTLLLHQHYLADVVSGGLLAWLVAAFSYRDFS